jgi:hypothetical protein
LDEPNKGRPPFPLKKAGYQETQPDQGLDEEPYHRHTDYYVLHQ